MKWGRKTSSPPSFGSLVITRVFPASWFSKFKQTGGSLETTSGKKQRGKLDFSTGKSSLQAGCRESRFYSLDGDAYWTLSFRKDRGDGRKRNKSGKINPLWYESDDEYLVAVSNFKSSGLRETQLPRRELEVISELDIDKTEQERCSNNILRENGASREKKRNRRSRKLRGRVDRKKKAECGTGLHEGEKESSNPEAEEEFQTEAQETDQGKRESQDSAVSNSRNHQSIYFQNLGQSSDSDGEEDYAEDRIFADLDGKGSTATSKGVSTMKCQNLENMKFEEIQVKTEFQEESAYMSRRSRSRKTKQNRMKGHGSRSECRIQPLADIKKARIKLKKKNERKKEATESSTIYNSFAVEKSSFNPQQDFRDSMVEMIKEKGIRHREELEELLACYLTLNCDEHHHLIISAFQQVWIELSKAVC